MRLSEYLKIRNGDSGAKALTKHEAKVFGVDTSKKGWWKEDKEVPFSVIATLVRKTLACSPNIKRRIRINLQTMDCPAEKDEKYLYLFNSPLGMSKIGVSKNRAMASPLVIAELFY